MLARVHPLAGPDLEDALRRHRAVTARARTSPDRHNRDSSLRRPYPLVFPEVFFPLSLDPVNKLLTLVLEVEFFLFSALRDQLEFLAALHELRLDLAALLSDSDLGSGDAGRRPSADEPDCAAIFAHFGLSLDDAVAPAQTAFVAAR